MIAKLKNRKLDNRGSSFVEIIVSVLIIGIIFVPLLLGMNTALIVNRMSQNEQYADTVAQNCIEAVKSLGKNTVEARDGASINEISSGATLSKLSDVQYRVSGIKQGTKEYTADIEFIDEYSGSGKQNDATGYSSIKSANTLNVNMTGVDLPAISDAVAAAHSMSNTTCTYAEAVAHLKIKRNIIRIKKYSHDATYGNKYVIQPEVYYEFYNDSDFFKSGGETYGYTKTLEPMAFDVCPTKIMTLIESVTDIEHTGINTDQTTITVGSHIESDSTKATVTCGTAHTQYVNQSVLIDNQLGMDKSITIYTYISGVGLMENNSAGYMNSKMIYEINYQGATTGTMNIFNPLPTETVYKSPNTITYTMLDKMVEDATADEITKMYKLKVTVKDVDSNYSLSRESTILS